MRTFLAVEVPQKERKIISDFILSAARYELPVKWVKFENLHITLKFLGEIDDKKRSDFTPAINDICRKHSPFKVRLERLGCFPKPASPRVLWLGVAEGSEELRSISDALEEGLAPFGFKEEKRFHPHLTIGRIKKQCRVDDILAGDISTDPFEVTSVVLFKSTLKPEGPIYEELFNFSLH